MVIFDYYTNSLIAINQKRTAKFTCMSLPKELKDNFCLMPWMHLYVGTDGKANACCNAPITFGSVRNESVESIWEGEKIKAFRAQLLRGEKDRRCAICYHKEAAGKSSIRTETLAKFDHHIAKVLEGKEPTKPIYLDIRFSNVCNLKCITCWHGASSSWFEDAKVLRTNVGDKAIIKATTDNARLIREVLVYSDELEEIYFAGGEPLLMEEHYELLAEITAKKSFSTRIRYNTNLTKLTLKDKSVIDYWKQLTNVQISISIDDKEERGEVIRKGLKWEQLIENIRTIQRECPHVVLEIAPTISIFTIFTVGELHRYFYEEGLIPTINSIYLNLLERPNYYNIQILTTEEKEKARHILSKHIVWLTDLGAKSELIDEFEAIVNYLFIKEDKKGKALLAIHSRRLDEIRKSSISMLYPKIC